MSSLLFENLPPTLPLHVGYAVAFSAGYAAFALLFTQIFATYTSFLYKAGKLARLYELPETTHRMGTFVSAFIVTLPSALFIALYVSFSSIPVTFNTDFNLGKTLFLSVLMAYTKDTLFYHTHRLMHQWRPLFTFSHATHHDEWPVNVWTIGHVDLVEYVLAAAPSHFLLTVFALCCQSEFNVWAWAIANWNISVIEILGHCGYETSIYLPVIWPPLLLGLFLPYTLAAADHERHHRYLHGNYSLIFSHWDRFYGTYIPPKEVSSKGD